MLNFIDFEVFRYDWLCIIANPIDHSETVIINNPTELEEYYTTHKDEIFIGYNIRQYDSYIFKAILAGFDPYDINDFIINKGGKGYQFSNLLRNYQLITYDLIQLNTSLKQLEAFQGHNIYESDVNFRLDRKLTEDEIKETVKYCRNDVQETMNLFIACKSDFDNQMELVNEFKLPMSYISKTQTQLTASILMAQRIDYKDEFDLHFPNYLNKIKKYRHIVDWYKNPENRNYSKSLSCNVAGVPHIFAWGGLHGAIPKYHAKGWYLHIDVNSYYPSLMITHDYYSRAVPLKGKERFERIYTENLSLKEQIKTAPKEKKEYLKRKRTAYKLVCNKTYGGFKDKYNNLYDPLMANNICVTGQLALLLLIEMLEPQVDLIQSNTDGLIVKLDTVDDFDIVDDICYEWECLTGVKLSFDPIITDIYQKDVNNYLFINELDEIESKGAYVKPLSVLDNDLPILNTALKNYMIHNTSVETTINDCDRLMDFQKIVKLSGKYDFVEKNSIRYTNKCYRVFASTRSSDTALYKCRVDGKKYKFANTPDHSFLENGDITNAVVPNYLNRQWYIDKAYERLRQFGVEA